jgi:hypothetical protein
VTQPKNPSSSEWELRARRLAGGARREASERVVIRGPGFETNVWTLNVSRGGLRIVVEEPLRLNTDYQVVMGDAEADSARSCTVVWVKDAADGQIVGLKYLDTEGSIPPDDE